MSTTTIRRRMNRTIGTLRARLAREDGATTAEYAITLLAACGFAAVLVALLRSEEVQSLLMGIVTSALGMGG
ncbi:DUF4244 domain-containing protein [Helcobacillus massiliensis]|uniref:DUF4244 domain-containing protein n=1 Tax=Helcobacillus TaxID=1161125 RepID=UPI001EF60031|nr:MULTISPECIES: DUF4244 domain-containing protein [Helcobacillus]MCG7428054.1 DUF4244 domain-containing protein [Helcobacillus sp. ACRRO]MCT1556615.1 DUF4244 domain-containing protein [Helcobacillus massiliensis]MCT2035809.1 DUF4244 domain-containing protein [Helcobacillus massiliensis]MCT2331109.1 DUF4244 domain-containing protein [Helcobacillus massiliensis]MDK7742012.1 DUF4244 domain-containing protein [Helcobacillus massiliensis]